MGLLNPPPRRGRRRVPEAETQSVGRVLAVVLGRLHLEDVRDDAVDGHVANQAGEEELLRDARVHEAQGRQAGEDAGQPADDKSGRVGFDLILFPSTVLVFQD